MRATSAYLCLYLAFLILGAAILGVVLGGSYPA